MPNERVSRGLARIVESIVSAIAISAIVSAAGYFFALPKLQAATEHAIAEVRQALTAANDRAEFDRAETKERFQELRQGVSELEHKVDENYIRLDDKIERLRR